MDLQGSGAVNSRAANQVQIKIGSRTFRVSTSPVVDDQRQWLGTVAEWIDRTQEVAVEEEIANIVVAASAGDLSMRIRKDGKDGFFATLADGMNGILTNMSTVVAEVNAVIEAGMSHDLTARINVDSKSGVFEQLSSGINALMDSMMKVVQQIKTAAQSVSSGSEEIAKGNADLSGRTEQQASSLEETASSISGTTAANASADATLSLRRAGTPRAAARSKAPREAQPKAAAAPLRKVAGGDGEWSEF